MRWSIRYQLLVPLLVLLVGVVGICSWTAAASADRAWQQIETQVRNVARTFCEFHFPLNENVLDQVRGLSGAEYLLVTADGRQMTTLSETAGLVPPPAAAADSWQSLHLGQRLTIGGHAYLCSAVRLQRPSAETQGILYILYPEALWRDARWDAIRPSLLLGGFVGLASLALAAGMAQRLSRRIRELGRRTRLIAAGDFSPMPLTGHHDELRDLGQSVNDMAQKLAQLQEAAQRDERLRLLGQVSGGLAHQLRNGVTGAMLAVQLHARECRGGADREALDVALRQLAILESNVQRFLELGKTNGQRHEPCPLAAVVDETVALLRPRCKHAHVDLRWQPPAVSLVVDGDRGQLGHLLLNLLSNAIEAAGPGGWVEVRTEPGDGRAGEGGSGRPVSSSCCAVEIIDSGPGPAPEVAGRLFEPFVTGKSDGVGLGLAVARQVAQAHGGTVTWKRATGQTCFRIELPLAEAKLAGA